MRLLLLFAFRASAALAVLAGGCGFGLRLGLTSPPAKGDGGRVLSPLVHVVSLQRRSSASTGRPVSRAAARRSTACPALGAVSQRRASNWIAAAFSGVCVMSTRLQLLQGRPSKGAGIGVGGVFGLLLDLGGLGWRQGQPDRGQRGAGEDGEGGRVWRHGLNITLPLGLCQVGLR